LDKQDFEELIDCAAKDLVYDIKESIKDIASELKLTIKEITRDLNEDFSELREGIRETLENSSDSAHGREYF